MIYVDIDFEYNSTSEKNLNVISVAYIVYSGLERIDERVLWLKDNPENIRSLKHQVFHFKERGAIFRAWVVGAEASAMLSLGIDVKELKWMDLMLEYRCLTNHNHDLAYGKQLIEGKVVRSYPPNRDNRPTYKTPHHLVSAIYKLLGKVPDVERKADTRELIVSRGLKDFTEVEKELILDYNFSDVVQMQALFIAILTNYKKLLRSEYSPEKLFEEMLYRGKFAARTAIMERLGYPINLAATRALTSQIHSILWEVASEINKLFPSIAPFLLDRSGKVVRSDLKIREWVIQTHGSDWDLTDPSKTHPRGQHSLSLEAFQRHYDFRHDYPKDSFGAQMVRFLKYKQNLYGFENNREVVLTTKKKKNFWDSVGRDARVRPYFNIYGAQSGRSQPAATSYIPLKPAWMRSLIQPAKGRAIAAVDWKSQEFLLSALISHDQKMVDAYNSGDVYLYFAKAAGAVPPEGTREEYEKERNMFKSTTLGLSYLMAEKGLAKKLTKDLGREVLEEEAKRLIQLFNDVYPTFYRYRSSAQDVYAKTRHVRMPSGWIMWGDNHNFRSVVNVKIQGTGADIMRHAIILAQDAGLEVILSLHDALYIEYEAGDFKAIDTLCECMAAAEKYVFRNDPWAFERANLGVDAKSWSDGYQDVKILTPGGKKVSLSALYIDERAVSEYNQFSKYFTQPQGFEYL